MNVLHVNSKIEVRDSLIHGKGVFAKDFIQSGVLIEECHFIPLQTKWAGLETILQEYVFAYPHGEYYGEFKSVIVLGFGSIYNHSSNNNAAWTIYMERKVFQFFTVKDIHKDEEICTNYGDEYEKNVKSKILK